MNKLIIDNRTELSDLEAVTLVGEVIKAGRISKYGASYCFATRLVLDRKAYMVWTDLNKKSDKFTITED